MMRPAASADAESEDGGGIDALEVGETSLFDHLDVLSVSTTRGPDLEYFGGKIIPNVRLYAIYWGPSVDATTQALVPEFMRAFTSSAMFDWLSEYDTNITADDGVPGTNQHIGRGSFAGAVTITPSTNATSITDAIIRDEVKKLIDQHVLPPADDNNMYVFFFPKDMSITGSTAGASCSQFCAYHGSVPLSGPNARYAVMPDLGPGSGCEFGCGSGPTTFDNLTSALSHEIIEAVTDPDVGTIENPIRLSSWYDIQHDEKGDPHGEIGDICNQMHTPLDVPSGPFTIQKQWSQRDNACKGIVTDDFELTFQPAQLELHGKTSETATVTVRATATKGNPPDLRLRDLLAPSDSTVTLSTKTLAMGQTATITVQVSPSIVNGTYYIGIVGDTPQISRRYPLAVKVVDATKPTPKNFCVGNSSNLLCQWLNCNSGGGSAYSALGWVIVVVARKLRRRFGRTGASLVAGSDRAPNG